MTVNNDIDDDSATKHGDSHRGSGVVSLSLRAFKVMFLGRNPELIVESVGPDFLHVIPIRDDNRAQWDTSSSTHRT